MKKYREDSRKKVYLSTVNYFRMFLLMIGLITVAGCSQMKGSNNAAAGSGNNQSVKNDAGHSTKSDGGQNTANESYSAENASASTQAGEKTSECRLSETDQALSQKINFSPASFRFSPETEKILQSLADSFKKLPGNCLIEIGVHTDNVGEESANLKLSQARADAIKEFLVNKGIENSNLAAKGYGSSAPKVPNTTNEGQAQNRRTEFKLFRKS